VGCGVRPIIVRTRSRSAAAEIGAQSWPQVLLKFVLGHPAVTCAIPGTGNPAHMIGNAAAGSGDLAAARARILAWWQSR